MRPQCIKSTTLFNVFFRTTTTIQGHRRGSENLWFPKVRTHAGGCQASPRAFRARQMLHAPAGVISEESSTFPPAVHSFQQITRSGCRSPLWTYRREKNNVWYTYSEFSTVGMSRTLQILTPACTTTYS